MTIEFTVPYPVRKSAWTKRYGFNAYWAGKKPCVRAADARDLETFVRLCLTRVDIDNHAAIEKMTVDALKGWLLRDDDRRHYREKHSFFYDKN